MAILLKVDGLYKSYGNIQVLADISININGGEILGLVGENGAGKSTLIKILSGVVKQSAGNFTYNDKLISNGWTIHEAQNEGMITIYQELSLVPELSAAENVCLGNWPTKPRGILDKRKMINHVRTIFAKMGVDIDPEARVGDLSIAAQQMIEIARAWLTSPKLVIFDEPTSSLSRNDAEQLHIMIAKMKQSGTGILYISHRLEDVISVCDRVYVLKDGCLTGEFSKDELSKQALIKMMIGRDISSFGMGGYQQKAEIFRIEEWCVKEKIHNISFALKAGEILGIAGLMGSGRSTLARSIFGAMKNTSGSIYIDGQPVTVNSPTRAIRNGIGFLPEDRRHQALFMTLAIRENISVASLRQLSTLGIIQKKEIEIVNDYFDKVKVRAPSTSTLVSVLSGGNQQKVVLARWLTTHCKILIFDEPTRGIDVGAKIEIYNLINRFVELGGAAIIISSEMPELISLSDRILVISEGHMTGEFLKNDISEDKLLEKMTMLHKDLEVNRE